MHKVKKFKGFEKHLRKFLILAKVLFGLVFIAHMVLLITGLGITIGQFDLPKIGSILVAFIAGSMMVMAAYYSKALGCGCKDTTCDHSEIQKEA